MSQIALGRELNSRIALHRKLLYARVTSLPVSTWEKGRYRMFESVTQMLEQLTWIPLSKRRENSRLILFYKIINNLAVVPHSCLEKADVRTRKYHSQKFRHIGYNIDPYGQSFFPNCISAWNGLAKDIAEANTLDIFNSKLQN